MLISKDSKIINVLLVYTFGFEHVKMNRIKIKIYTNSECTFTINKEICSSCVMPKIRSNVNFLLFTCSVVCIKELQILLP